jgi:hypothetical protein
MVAHLLHHAGLDVRFSAVNPGSNLLPSSPEASIVVGRGRRKVRPQLLTLFPSLPLSQHR